MVSNFRNINLLQKVVSASCLSLAVTAMILCSCEMVIDADLPLHKPAITLNGTFHPDSSIQVRLTEDNFILEKHEKLTFIQNATVQLYSGTALIGKLQEDSIPGLYRINYYPEAGVEYRITAAKDGFKTVEAIDVIPVDKANFSIGSVEEQRAEFSGPTYRVSYTVDDPIGEDYYETRLYMYRDIMQRYHDEDTVYYYSVGKKWYEISYVEAGAQLNEFNYSTNRTFSDELFDGRQKEFKLEFYYNRNYNDTTADTLSMLLEVRKISQSYYDYVSTKTLQNKVNGNIFAEPAPVYNNIKNGFGIFAGYNPKTFEFEVIYSVD